MFDFRDLTRTGISILKSAAGLATGGVLCFYFLEKEGFWVNIYK